MKRCNVCNEPNSRETGWHKIQFADLIKGGWDFEIFVCSNCRKEIEILVSEYLQK